MMKYFRLNPECYLVTGGKRSVIYNLIEKSSLWITEEATELLKKSELNQPIVEEDIEFFQLLEEKKWGVFTDTPVFIDKYRPYNIFNEKKFHKNSPMIELALIQISNQCNLNCEFCNDFYCPVCIRKDSKKQALTLNEWFAVIDQLRLYGLKTVILTGGEVALYEELDQLLKYMEQKDIFVTLQTNGLIRIKGLSKKYGLVISLFDAKNIDIINENYQDFDNVTLLSYSDQLDETMVKNKTWRVRKCSTSMDVMCRELMNNADVLKFHARRTFDNCLKNRISIDYAGDVYPCFEVKEPLGNVQDEKFYLVIKKLIGEYWMKSVDKRETKCAACEFRYSCNSCNLYDATSYCKYDVEESVWR